MDEFKKKIHEEFDERFNWKEIFGENSKAQKEVKTFLDTTLDNLLVEVEGLVPKEKMNTKSNDPMERLQIGIDYFNACREMMSMELARFKGEEKV